MRPLNLVDVATPVPSGDGDASVVRVRGTDVALFRVAGTVHALADFCIRCGASLAGGEVAGPCVSCRRCRWRYDIPSGRLTELPALATDRFDVQVHDGRVRVAMEPGGPVARRPWE